MSRLLNTVAFRLALGYGALVLGAVAVISAILYFGTVGVLVPGINAKIFAISERLTTHFETRGIAALQQEIQQLLTDGIDQDTEVYLLLGPDGQKIRPEAVANLDEMRAIPLFGSNNEIITLGQVADVQALNGFARIYREENERCIAVKFAVRGRDLGSMIADAERRVSQEVQIPRGYRLEWTGSFENQQRAVKRLAFIIPITIVAIFFVLFTAFNSLLRVIIILLNIPLAAVGGIVGLGIAGIPISVSALVGFVALFGIAIQYGVIMLERIRELEMEDAHINALDAARDAALTRLRPILMTSMMAALGLLPAALSQAVGAETARPFAVVIVGGLICVTPLTLLVLPVAMTFFLPLTRRRQAAAPALAT